MLHEDYRPKTWEGFIGNAKAVYGATQAVKAHWLKVEAAQTRSGLAMLIQGASGTGKSTACQLLAADFGAADMDVLHLDGDKCTAQAVRDLEQSGGFLSTRPWGKAKAICVDECHAMSRQAVNAWLTLLERLPKWCLVCFTTTEGTGKDSLFGDFASPFTSRCVNINLTNQGLAQAFAAHVKAVAEKEGLGGAADKEYLRLVQDCKNNLREALSRVQAGEMVRTIDDEELAAGVAA